MTRITKQHHIFWTVGLFILLQSCGCGKAGQADAPKEEDDRTIKIQVGTRDVETDQFTSKGTPVVPMWKAPMATVDIRNGAGFPILSDAEHDVVWQPSVREDGAYNHYACLIHHNGRFYAMWGNHEFGEDAPGQRVLYAHADEWGNWTDAEELFPAPGPVLPRSENGIHLKPDCWAIIDDVLYAITYVHGAGVYPIARAVSEEGTLGEPFLVQSLPNNGSLPVFMEGDDAPTAPSPIGERLYRWYRENDQISWWANASWGVQRTAVDGQSLIESFIYRAKDGGLVLMLRDWGHANNPVHTNRMYVSFNDGTGGWAAPYPTDIPDSPSRAQALTLEDGTVLLIGNQNVNRYDQALYLDRDPMTISISKDGYTFDRVYALRTGSPTGHRFSGIGGRNPGYAYSSSIVRDGWLYTMYSIGKEDMGITRVPLSALELE
ncbi:BNR repeat-like domain-containing protein [Parapedobacter luteus]|uniref:BNR repeat-like domain-containing protein n=1 Tax=Parapedobacter luteus TaxID=623280 RepID=A0A1T5CCC7_9SPHI|nr:exo-alpha-sialidase [Parapedobacter luteus]SKB57003.1 BNR repeat-like domain-containing protein [Parapedobacter luteus]